jgi:hypothetical protein
MNIGTLVSNNELGRGLVIENEGSGWLVCWYEHDYMKTIVFKSSTFPFMWACGGGFGAISVLSLGRLNGKKSG